MLAKDLKPGTVFNYNDTPHLLEGVTVQSPSARGGATLYKFRARNLITKNKTDLTCKGTDNLQDADFERREVTLMYTTLTRFTLWIPKATNNTPSECRM